MYSAVCSKAETYKTITLYKDSKRLVTPELSKSPSFITYQLATFDDLVARDSIDPVQYSIQRRFGEHSSLTNYLIPK